MKKVIILLMAMLPVLAFSQKMTRAEKEAQQEKQHRKMMKLIDSKTFVLEAHTLRDRYGNQMFVNPNTNFVAVADSVAVLQVALNNAQLGLNGLGGETLDGRVSRYEVVDRGPGKGARVRMTFFGVTAIDLFLDVSDTGNANIRLSGIRGQSIEYVGDLRPLAGSDIFVGTPTF